MDTITFTELVKLIHPDHNPHITNAGEKMAIVTRNRNNPSVLFSYAVDWGLVTPSKNYTFNKETKTYHFEIGNVVIYHNTKRAVIVDIQNAKGKRSGQYKVFMVDIINNKLYHFFIPTLDTELRDIKVIGKAPVNQKAKANTIYNRYTSYKNNNKEYKKKQDKSREEKNKEYLNPHRYYWDFNVWVVSKTRIGRFQVIRTTAKMVYYWDHYENKERSFKMSSIINIEYR
jgi:hypothetical protein